MTRTIKVFLGALLLAAASPMTAVAAQEGAEQSGPTPPEKVARDTVETILEEMEGRRDELRRNPDKLDALIDCVLLPLVDIDYMSQLVLGRHWRDASEAQRERFKNAFKQMLIQTYGGALLEFEKDQVEFKPLRAEEGAEDVTFHAEVTTESGETVQVDLDLHLVDGAWRIYNGSVGNLTFVTNYRGQFNQEIRRNGLESLIGKLESRYTKNTTAQKEADAEQ